MGRIRVPWTRQPQGAVGIDWSNPLTRGLVFLESNNNTFGASRRISGVVDRGVSTQGSGLRFGNATANSVIFSSTNLRPSSNAPFTLVTVYQLTALPSGSVRIASSFTTGARGYSILPNNTNFRGVFADGTNYVLTGGAVSLNPKVDVLRYGNGEGSLFENGRITAGPSVFPCAASNIDFYIGSDGSGSNSAASIVPLVLFFNRALSDAEIKKLTVNPWQVFLPLAGRPFFGGTVAATAALTGTVTTTYESEIVTGGKTIILTLTGDTWVAAGATFDGQRQNIIDGLTSAGSDLLGWNNVVKALQGVAGVVRTSSTVVTITLDAQATYSISSDETITATIPSTALTGAVAVVAAPTFTITQGAPAGGHATSGALATTGAVVAGTAARFRAFATTGVLATAGAEVVGAATRFRAMSTAGALATSGATVSGTAARFRAFATTGALAPTGAVVAGTAARAGGGPTTHDGTGALATTGAVVAGTAARFRAFATTGVLSAAGAEVVGSATRFRAFATSGVLSAAGAAVAGSATRFRTFGTSGALATAGAAVVGTSLRYRAMGSSGALVTAGATVAGTAARFRAFGTSGALATGGAVINGSALHTTPGGGVYPDPADVRAGVVYGPTGVEFTGTMSILLDLNTGRLVKIIGQKVALLL